MKGPGTHWLELDVGAVAPGGACVARAADGRVVFIRHTLPGERVRARVTEQRAHYLRADAVEILRAAPERVPTPCRYAGPGACGGCDWQHVDLAAQRRGKAAVIAEQFHRLAGLAVSPEVCEVPGAPDGLGWRTRVSFAVAARGEVGFRRYRSHAVQPVDRCLIAHPLVDSAGVAARRWPGADSVTVSVGVASGDRLISPPGQPPGVIRQHAAGRRWRVSAGAFWQVHPGAADALVATVLELTDPAPGEHALDLYSGVGLFAGALGERVGADGSVLAIEGNRRAAADAAHNLADLPHVRVRRAGVDAGLLRRLPPAELARGLVILDPPRSGAGRDVVTALARTRARAICYVGCDPATLARDVATFGRLGYRLAALRALDIFPMTAHVECVALLTRC